MSERMFNGEAVEVEVLGVKCDAEGCTFFDPEVSFSQMEQFIDKPCPICGAPLLTREDYAATLAILGIATLTNSEAPRPPAGSERVRIAFEMDGSGKIEAVTK